MNPGTSFGELTSIEPFDLPTQFEEKYEVIRGNTVIAIVYDKPTFTIDVWYYGIPHRVGKPRRFDTSDFFELMRRNPVLNNYHLGPTGRAMHVLVVILEQESSEAFIVPRSTYEMLSTIPADQMVTEIRRLSSDQTKSSGRSEEVNLSKKFMVFVAYDNDTGLDFAQHLRGALQKRGISTFVAKTDLPSFIKGDVKWRQVIDHVIGTCNTFILVLSTDNLSKEVARESRLAFARNRTESEFSILICHLEGTPRTDQQLIGVGIDSKEYQQKDFTTLYDLARIVTSSLDNEGFPKTPESVHEPQSTRVELVVEEPTQTRPASETCPMCGTAKVPHEEWEPIVPHPQIYGHDPEQWRRVTTYRCPKCEL